MPGRLGKGLLGSIGPDLREGARSQRRSGGMRWWATAELAAFRSAADRAAMRRYISFSKSFRLRWRRASRRVTYAGNPFRWLFAASTIAGPVPLPLRAGAPLPNVSSCHPGCIAKPNKKERNRLKTVQTIDYTKPIPIGNAAAARRTAKAGQPQSSSRSSVSCAAKLPGDCIRYPSRTLAITCSCGWPSAAKSYVLLK